MIFQRNRYSETHENASDVGFCVRIKQIGRNLKSICGALENFHQTDFNDFVIRPSSVF